MKVIRKIFVYLGLAVLGLVVAALMLPFVYKDKAVEFLGKKVNEHVNANVTFKDLDISFLRSFPDVSFGIDSLLVTGVDTFYGITLYSADRTTIDVSLPSLIGKNKIPHINSLVLDHPEINIVSMDSTLANYNIMKGGNDKDSAAFKIELEDYRINNGTLTYHDVPGNLMFRALGVDHSGSGDFTQDVFDLTTETKISEMHVKYEGTKYLTKATAQAKAVVHIDLPQDKYSFNGVMAKLNDLDFTADGFFQFKKEDILTDVTFKTASESFKSLLSLLPSAYTKDFASVKSSGKASFDGYVKGAYNGSLGKYPAFDIKIKVDNGYVKYPGMTQEIKDVFADMRIKAARSDYKDMNINIPTFRLKIGNDPVSGHLLVNNLTGNQDMDGHLKGRVDLNTLRQAYPIEGMEDLSGVINADLEFKAKMSDVQTENYKAIQFKGTADATSVRYRSKDMPAIQVGSAHLTASPSQVTAHSDNITMGKSDMKLNALISNPLAAFSSEKSVRSDIKLTSDLLDLNEWMAKSTTTTTNATAGVAAGPNEEMLKNSSLHLDLKAGKVLYDKHELNNVAIHGNIAANAMKLENMSATIKNSDLKLSGALLNVYDYLFNNGVLDGNLSFVSNRFDANQFLAGSSTARDTVDGVLPVPERVRVAIETNIKDLTYTNLNLRDFTGVIEVNNREAAIRDMKTSTLGGTIAMQGLYSTRDISKPDFAIKLDLSEIKFAEAIKKIDMLKKAAPVAEYINGFFNTSLVMKGHLGGDMSPDLQSLDASGLFETLSGSVKGFKPLKVISEKLGLNELSEVKLDNTKNWFEIINGFVELKAFKKTIKGIDLSMYGRHGFGKDMDYNIDMVVPRELLKKNKVTAVGESGLSMLEKEAGKLGINIEQGPNIYLNVKLTGSLASPNVKITPLSGKGGTLEQAAGEAVRDVVATVKDTITKEVKKKEAELRDTITKRVNEEVQKVKTKAEDMATKAIDSLKQKAKDEVITKVDSLTKGVIPDSLRKKAEEVLNKKTGEEVEKIKDKLKDFNPFKKKGKGQNGS